MSASFIPGPDSLNECVNRVEAMLKLTAPADRQSVAIAVAQWASNFASLQSSAASASRKISTTMPAVEGDVTVGPRNKR